MKGINRNAEKLETYSVTMRESFISSGPEDIEDELFSAVNQLPFSGMI